MGKRSPNLEQGPRIFRNLDQLARKRRGKPKQAEWLKLDE